MTFTTKKEPFFIDGPGGTGKTFLTNLLLATIRKSCRIALAVASSKVAATLLTGGRTAHSVFKLPLNLNMTDPADAPVCRVTKNSGTGKLLQICLLIVWDECTMSHKNAFKAVDKTLRNTTSVMGGVMFVSAGDFRQTLPIIRRGTQANQVRSCLKSSYPWDHVETLSLSTNMRALLSGDQAVAAFLGKLLQLGEGIAPTNSRGFVELTNVASVVGSPQLLIEPVFTNRKIARR